MTTPLQIITRALQTINQLGEGEDPTATQSNDGLVYFNDLVQSWNNDGLMIYERSFATLSMTGAQSYTIGASGNLNISRPMSIDNAYFTQGGVDYPLDMLSREQYEAIPQKSQASTMANAVYIADTYPLMTCYVFPKASAGTITFSYHGRLMAASTLSTVLSLPDGYERALRYCLAAEMMPEYGLANPLVLQMAAQSKAVLMRTNQKPRLLLNTLPTLGGSNQSSLSRFMAGM